MKSNLTITPIISYLPNTVLKMDCLIAGQSHKVRSAKYIIDQGVKRGDIIPGKTTILEKTGGGFGFGLVLAAKAYDLDVDLAIGLSYSQRKKDYLKKYGANLIGIDMLNNGLQPKQVIEYYLANQLQLNKSYFYTDQFNNIDNLQSHLLFTGPEIVAQLKDYQAKHMPHLKNIVFISTAGTGAHLTGIAKCLQQAFNVQTILVEPDNCDTKENITQTHPFEGINVGVMPPFLDWQLINRIEKVSLEQAKQAQSRLAIHAGYYVGLSSSACLAVLERLQAQVQNSDDTLIFTMMYDLGFWYD